MKQFRLLATIVALGALTVSVFADDSDKFEPLIISDGFNRDVIAENTPYTNYGKSYYNLTDSKNHVFATKDVIEATNNANEATINSNNQSSGKTLTDEIKAQLKEYGWPNDYPNSNPTDRRVVQCQTDTYSGLYWQLGAYDVNNALCLRNNGYSGHTNTGRFTFANIGCYKKLYFLTLAGGASNVDRTMHTTVYYSTGDPESRTFEFADCAGVVNDKRAYQSNMYSSNGFIKGSNLNNGSPVYAAVNTMDIDHTRLIDSIHFEYTGDAGAGVAIFAVTGEVASDVAVPAAEKVEVKDIEKTSFEACWEAIANAASYRLDVATDIDFQHLVEGYNNLAVEGTTCKEVAGLLADNDYYWRIRSVDEAGYQSKSSAPMRVRTAGGEPPATDEVHTDIAEQLAPLINTSVSQFQIDRTLYRDGYYNTICLPFNLSAGEIAASPLAGATVYEFDGATKKGNHQLDIEVSETDHIVAGVPYLITWDPTEPEIIDEGHLIFRNVTILTNEGQTIGDEDKVRFVGNVSRQLMMYNNVNNLFVGAENTLYWPNTTNPLRGFRAYFLVPEDGPAGVPKNSPARIVQRHETTTEIEHVQNDNVPCTKVFKDGQLVIIKNGTYYNAQGQIIYVQ